MKSSAGDQAETRSDLPADVQRIIKDHPTASLAEIAARVFISRRDRQSGPAGRCDNGGRWYPSSAEDRQCCDMVRSPSRGWPWSKLKHCSTLLHVCNLLGVTQGDAKLVLRQIDPQIAIRAANRATQCVALRREIEQAYARGLVDAGVPQETADAFARDGAACIAQVKSIPMLRGLLEGNAFHMRIKKHDPALYQHIRVTLRLAFVPEETS